MTEKNKIFKRSISYACASVLGSQVRSRQEVIVQQISQHVKDPSYCRWRAGVSPLVPLSSENLRNFRWVASRRDTPEEEFAAAITPHLLRSQRKTSKGPAVRHSTHAPWNVTRPWVRFRLCPAPYVRHARSHAPEALWPAQGKS